MECSESLGVYQEVLRTVLTPNWFLRWKQTLDPPPCYGKPLQNSHRVAQSSTVFFPGEFLIVNADLGRT